MTKVIHLFLYLSCSRKECCRNLNHCLKHNNVQALRWPWTVQTGTTRLQYGGGGGLSSHQMSLQTPSQWTELPAAAPDSSQHPVNTVHLGYLLFERCDKQWQSCIVNMWAHEWFELHNCWICPENLSTGGPKCTLTQNKPLLVTEGAALGGHGLCQTSRRVKTGEAQTLGGNGGVGLERRGNGCFLCFWVEMGY